MSTQIEKMENSTAKLTFEISAEEFEAAVQKEYLKQRGKISLPGFRKGKAPRKMIEKMYGAGIFWDGALNACIPAAYTKALEEVGTEIEIASQPEFDLAGEVVKGQPITVTAVVAVVPEVKLGQYKGVEVSVYSDEVAEEEVTARLVKEQNENSRIINVDDRPVQNDDDIKLDFKGSVDGVPFEGGEAMNYALKVGSNSFIPGFEEQIVGKSIGEEFEVNVTFPEDYQAEELAGKAAVFACKVNEISVKELPELDDEFAQEVSEFDTLDEYKASIVEELKKEKAESNKRRKETEALSVVAKAAEMVIPEQMIAEQVDRIFNEFGGRLQSQGLDMEQYFQFTSSTPESLREMMKPEAEQRIRNSLVLEAIVDAEKLEPSEEAVEAEINKIVESTKMTVEQVKEILAGGQMDQFKREMAIQMALELIASTAVEVEKAAEETTEE